METLTIIRVLLRLRLLLGLGALLALAGGVVAMGKLGIGPVDSTTRQTWTATAELQLDTPRPLVADALASASTIQTQTIMLADYLTSDGSRDRIARAAGLDRAEVSLRPLAIDMPIRQSPLVYRAAQAATEPTTPYTLTTSTAQLSPLMALVATGPQKETTLALARAAVQRAVEVLSARPAGPAHKLALEELGEIRVDSYSTGGTRLVLGVAAALFLFGGWCVALVVGAGVVRAWRSLALESTAAQ